MVNIVWTICGALSLTCWLVTSTLHFTVKLVSLSLLPSSKHHEPLHGGESCCPWKYNIRACATYRLSVVVTCWPMWPMPTIQYRLNLKQYFHNALLHHEGGGHILNQEHMFGLRFAWELLADFFVQAYDFQWTVCNMFHDLMLPCGEFVEVQALDTLVPNWQFGGAVMIDHSKWIVWRGLVCSIFFFLRRAGRNTSEPRERCRGGAVWILGNSVDMTWMSLVPKPSEFHGACSQHDGRDRLGGAWPIRGRMFFQSKRRGWRQCNVILCNVTCLCM